MRRFKGDILIREHQTGFRDIHTRRMYNAYLAAGAKIPKRRVGESPEDYIKRVQAFHRAQNNQRVVTTTASSSSSRRSNGQCPICLDEMYEDQRQNQQIIPLHQYLRCTKCYGAQFIERDGIMQECDCQTDIESRKHYCHRACIEGPGKYLSSLRNKSPQYQRCPLCRETIHFNRDTLTLCQPSIAIGFRERNYPMLRSLIRADPSLVNVTDDNGNTPLHRLLLEGIEQGERGKTPEENKLIVIGRMNFLEFLLDQDCDLMVQNNDGNTPLHILFSLMSLPLIHRFRLPHDNSDFIDEWKNIQNKEGQNIFDLDTTEYFRRAFRKRKKQSRDGGNNNRRSSRTPSPPVIDMTVFQEGVNIYAPSEEEKIKAEVNEQFRKLLRKRKRQLHRRYGHLETLDSDEIYQKLLKDKERTLESRLEKYKQDRAYEEAKRMDALKHRQKKKPVPPTKKPVETIPHDAEDQRRRALWNRITGIRQRIRIGVRNKKIRFADANTYMAQLDTVRALDTLEEAERRLEEIIKKVNK